MTKGISVSRPLLYYTLFLFVIFVVDNARLYLNGELRTKVKFFPIYQYEVSYMLLSEDNIIRRHEKAENYNFTQTKY